MSMNFSVCPRRGIRFYVLKIEGLKWYEIDDEADLEYAEKNIVEYC